MPIYEYYLIIGNQVKKELKLPKYKELSGIDSMLSFAEEISGGFGEDVPNVLSLVFEDFCQADNRSTAEGTRVANIAGEASACAAVIGESTL